jgi:hypothetical protein
VRRWRPVIVEVTNSTPGVTGMASPSRRVPCWQLDVGSEADAARLARALEARGVPARAVTIGVAMNTPGAAGRGGATPPNVALQRSGTRVCGSAALAVASAPHVARSRPAAELGRSAAPSTPAARLMRRLVLPLAFLTSLPAGVAAQDGPAGRDGSRRAVRVVVDNDLFAVRGGGVPPDYDYTHGTRATVAWRAAPRWLRRRGGVSGTAPGCHTAAARAMGCRAASLTVGQEIYTPRQDAPAPVPGERPYAGWLHATGAAVAVRAGRTRTLAVTAGVTGPPSLARPVQDGVHRLMRNQPQLGWAHQLRAGAGVEVAYAEVRRGERRVGGSGIAAVRGQWGATLGTVRAGLGVGGDGTLGLRGPRPWSPAEPEVERPPRAYLLGGVRQDWVLRDAFVEGRGARAGAVRRPLVPQGEVGGGYRWRALAVEYRHVVRGRAYRAQPAAHAVGSVRVTVLR